MQPPFPYTPAAPDVSRSRADALITWLRDWAERNPDLRLMDERRCMTPKVALDLGNRGLFGLQIPESHGGLALRHIDMHRIMEQLAAIDVSLASLLFIHNVNGVRPLADWASAEIRDEILPQIAAGRMLSSFGLTEPAAGSDTAGIQTLATPIGNGRWQISGVKRWNASGWTGVITVFAREPSEGRRLGRITGFVLKTDEPGVQFGPETLTMGVRSIMQNGIVFNGAECDTSRIVGAHGRGDVVADETLLLARVYMGSMAIGGMKRCLQLMHRFTLRRKIGEMRLVDSPLTQRVLDRVTARITASEAMVGQCLAALEAGEPLSEEACMAVKVLTTDWLGETADDLVQTLGGRGFMEQNLAPMIYRDVRMTRIGDGVNEVLAWAIGRRLRHAAGFKALMCETLEAPDLYDQLIAALNAAEARVSAPGQPGGDWARALAGTAACEALAVAALRSPPVLPGKAPFDEGGLEAARAWSQARYAAALERCQTGAEEEPRLAGQDQIARQVAQWAGDIGDIENTPPGIETEMDPLLRRDWGLPEHPDYAGLPGDHVQARPPSELAAPVAAASVTPLQPAPTNKASTAPDASAARDRAAALLRARLAKQ